MSTAYKLRLHITDYDRKKVEAIKEACENTWGFDDELREVVYPASDHLSPEIIGSGDGYLYSGTTEESAAGALAAAIWKANGCPCSVDAYLTPLETGNSYYFDEENPPGECDEETT